MAGEAAHAAGRGGGGSANPEWTFHQTFPYSTAHAFSHSSLHSQGVAIIILEIYVLKK